MVQFESGDMHSGGIYLVLVPSSRWEEFPSHASHWIAKLAAEPLSDPIISVDECLQEVKIEDGFFWITYDDFQSAIHLKPKEKKFNEIVLRLQKQLKSEAASTNQ